MSEPAKSLHRVRVTMAPEFGPLVVVALAAHRYGFIYEAILPQGVVAVVFSRELPRSNLDAAVNALMAEAKNILPAEVRSIELTETPDE